MPFRLVCFCHPALPLVSLFWQCHFASHCLAACPDILICHPASLLSSYAAIVVLPYPCHHLGANECPLSCIYATSAIVVNRMQLYLVNLCITINCSALLCATVLISTEWSFMHCCLCCAGIKIRSILQNALCVSTGMFLSLSSMASLQPYGYCMPPLPNP